MLIPKSTFLFFDSLRKNNNRDWFTKNKSTFKDLEFEIKLFGDEIKNRLNNSDFIDRFKLFRIYRDVRFSKDKTPYKKNIGMAFHRSKPELRGGYYLEISADKSFIAVGFWNPNKEDLLRIRKEIEIDGQEFRNIINKKIIKDYWGGIKGEEVKRSPKGFDANHEHIDLIRKKQFIFIKELKEAEIIDVNFQKELVKHFVSIRPFFDYMSEVLTTNLNGESLI